MAIVVLLYEYTNVFDSWLAWIFVPVMVSLIAYDLWLRAIRAMRGDYRAGKTLRSCSGSAGFRK
jgi:hypothetical protein